MPFVVIVVLVVAAAAIGLITGWLTPRSCPVCERRTAEDRARLRAGGWTPMNTAGE